MRERVVRMVEESRGEHESRWAAIWSVAAKLGCNTESLRRWVRPAEVDEGKCSGVASSDAERILQLDRENRELRKANEILKVASAFFAQAEFDRRTKS